MFSFDYEFIGPFVQSIFHLFQVLSVLLVQCNTQRYSFLSKVMLDVRMTYVFPFISALKLILNGDCLEKCHKTFGILPHREGLKVCIESFDCFSATLKKVFSFKRIIVLVVVDHHADNYQNFHLSFYKRIFFLSQVFKQVFDVIVPHYFEVLELNVSQEFIQCPNCLHLML